MTTGKRAYVRGRVLETRHCEWCTRAFVPHRSAFSPAGVARNRGRFCSRSCIFQGRAQRATVTPSQSDLAWAAGFLEGEGTFTIARYKDGRTRSFCCVKATQVQREPLERLQQWFGGGLFTVKRKYTPEQQLQSVWSVSGARARGVAMTMYPWMSPKRRSQIEQAISGDQSCIPA